MYSFVDAIEDSLAVSLAEMRKIQCQSFIAKDICTYSHDLYARRASLMAWEITESCIKDTYV